MNIKIFYFFKNFSDYNIFYFLSPRNVTGQVKEADNSVIVVIARLDALNIFDKEEVTAPPKIKCSDIRKIANKMTYLALSICFHVLEYNLNKTVIGQSLN